MNEYVGNSYEEGTERVIPCPIHIGGCAANGCAGNIGVCIANLCAANLGGCAINGCIAKK